MSPSAAARPGPLADRAAAWRSRLPASLPAAGSALLVALDVDGTLLGPGGAPTGAVREAVRALYESGAHVALCTGRSVIAAEPIARDLGLHRCHVVCSNGAVAARLDDEGYEVTDVVTFDPGPVVRTLMAELPGLLFAVEDLGRGFTVNAPFPPGELSGGVEVAGVDELVATPASRVTVRAPEIDGRRFEELVGAVGLHGVSYAVTHGHSTWLDITPQGVTKASGMEALRGRLGVGPGATVAIGDGGNDIPMLEWAAHGVAMGQAETRVAAAADARTDEVAADGVAVVLRALLEGPRPR